MWPDSLPVISSPSGQKPSFFGPLQQPYLRPFGNILLRYILSHQDCHSTVARLEAREGFDPSNFCLPNLSVRSAESNRILYAYLVFRKPGGHNDAAPPGDLETGFD